MNNTRRYHSFFLLVLCALFFLLRSLLITSMILSFWHKTTLISNYSKRITLIRLFNTNRYWSKSMLLMNWYWIFYSDVFNDILLESAYVQFNFFNRYIYHMWFLQMVVLSSQSTLVLRRTLNSKYGIMKVGLFIKKKIS